MIIAWALCRDNPLWESDDREGELREGELPCFFRLANCMYVPPDEALAEMRAEYAEAHPLRWTPELCHREALEMPERAKGFRAMPGCSRLTSALAYLLAEARNALLDVRHKSAAHHIVREEIESAMRTNKEMNNAP